MQTFFTPDTLTDPLIQEADGILRKCVHCGFCTATCPTYVLLGDEADSPRGRIYMIKNTLETNAGVSPKVVKHIDRCLSCLSCMTTCPSGVDYMHLVDQARIRIEENHTRPLMDRLLRSVLAKVVPSPTLFRLALTGAWLARPLRALFPGRLGAIIGLAPKRLSGGSPIDRPQTIPAQSTRLKRVVLMTGCAQKTLRTEINEATVRLLSRLGCEVIVPEGGVCCGALVHHMGRESESLSAARANIAAWEAVADEGGLDAVVINASGCGTTVKDYGYMLSKDPEWAERAERMAGLACDVTELLEELGVEKSAEPDLPKVAYHSACSMQHGQKLKDGPRRLLEAAGFSVSEPGEGHLCCGSAGTYNMLQPELANQLKERKAGRINALGADVVASGNIGCLVQLSDAVNAPIVHTVELLDWASGGPKPPELS